jgi:hypothetical protein
MKKAIWFSHHDATREQVAEITTRGYELARESEGKSLGSMAINDESDLHVVMCSLRFLKPDAVFGVFSAPVQAAISVAGQTTDDREVPCFAAWNVNRSPEGEKPQFEHRKFVRVGTLCIRS